MMTLDQFKKEILKEWEVAHRLMPVLSCVVEDKFVYLGASSDYQITDSMFFTKKNPCKSMMYLFFKLAKKYYPSSKKSTDSYFLDIGAHIGTTSIFVKSDIDPTLNVIGFEISKSNYNFFKANCFLNNIDVSVEHLGLSNKTARMMVNYNTINSAGTSLGDTKKQNGDVSESVTVTMLDKYLSDKNIPPEAISYIWLDVEGHEYEVIQGAIHTLHDHRIPFIQEFNPTIYIRKGLYESYCTTMSDLYDYFIDVHQKDLIPHPIEELKQYGPFMISHPDGFGSWIQTDLFFY